MSKRRKTLYLVDGMGIAYRAFFAFIQRPLTTSDGRNVSAVYGFTTFLNRILMDERPDYLAVAFDTAEPTFRHEVFEEYKATRERMPEDLSGQLDALKDVIRAHRVPLLEIPGFEADDIIGTLAVKGEQAGLNVFMVTGDKDYLQLVTDHVKVYRPGKQGTDPEIVDRAGVKERFGVAPEQVVDVLGLTGDSSDNVPGVPGIGEKTAIPLIQQYRSIANLYQHLDEIPKKGVKTKLTEHREKALLSRELVTIRTDVAVEFDAETFRVQEPDVPALRSLYSSMEFRSLLSRLGSGASDDRPAPAAAPAEPPPATYVTIATDTHTYHHVQTPAEMQPLLAALAKTRSLVFDTETTSTDPLRAQLVGISFAVREREAWFVRLVPPETGQPGLLGSLPGMAYSEALPLLKPFLEDPSVAKCGHNIKYDMHVMQMHGIEVRGELFDTMVASYILRADAQHGMDAVAREVLGYDPVSYSDLTGTGKEQRSLLEVDPQALADYACEDADITLRLRDELQKRLRDAEMEGLASDMEMPLVSVLRRVERHGVSLDVPYLESMSHEMGRAIDRLARSIVEMAGEDFNINSTKQLGAILFDKLKLPVVRRTKTGYSTDANVLEALRHRHPIVEAILEHRQLAKLKSTYVDALPAMIHPATGKIHTSFSQTVAATGRLSSSDPNLQNIPIRTDAGRAIRRAFIASGPGEILTSADYSQIELRIMAHIADDEGLSEAFRRGEDIHTATAASVFGVSSAEVTPDMRRKAKEVNFGIMYGIGPFGLANRLEISQTEAKEIIDQYFVRFPNVKQYINDTIDEAARKGYVETLLGRRRYLPDLNSGNRAVRQNAERQAINMPIQGTAADMIKLAMVRIDRRLQEEQLASRMVLQVHDELVFDGPSNEAKTLRKIVEKEMKEALPLRVPLVVDVGTGGNWLDAH